MDEKLNKIKGCIFGMAIGDALGATVEFMVPREIKKQYGVLKDIIGGGWLHLEAGEYTDDTQMAMILAESIIRKQKLDLIDIGEGYVEWMESNPPDIGRTTRAAITNLQKGISPVSSGMDDERSQSNGSMMRCAPIGVAFYKSKLLKHFSSEESAVTHAHPKCILGCEIVNQIMGRSSEDIIKTLFPNQIKIAQELYDNLPPNYGLIEPEIGLIDTLDSLKQKNKLIAIATNRRERSLRIIVEQYNLYKYVPKDYICSKVEKRLNPEEKIYLNDFQKSKPDPECLIKALHITNTKPEEAIYVGDAKEDQIASDAAGIFFVGYKTNFECKNRIEDHREIFNFL
ncbi:ADP-ribosylglycohydrolase family protein [Nanoarchaeota archaeon]